MLNRGAGARLSVTVAVPELSGDTFNVKMCVVELYAMLLVIPALASTYGLDGA